MKFRWDKKYLHWGITAFLVICASICFYYMLFHSTNIWNGFQVLTKIIMPILDGFILAYLLAPILNFIEKKLLYPAYASIAKIDKQSFSEKAKKNIRKLGILFTSIFAILFLYCFFSILIPQLLTSIENIILQFPYYIHNLNDWILGIFADNPDIEGALNNLLVRYSSKVEDWVTSNLIPQANSLLKLISTGLIGSVINLALALWNLIIGFIISIYLLDGKERFAGQGKKIIYSCFNTDTANVFISNVRFIHRTFIGFIGGKIVDSIIIGILCYFGTTLIHTPYPVLVSVIVGVTNVIPFFGPYMGAIPSAILILMVDPLQCFYFIIFIFLLQQFDGNILGPKILGDSTGLNSFWVIFAITLFGGLLGVLGMVIGVPVFAVIYAGVKAMVHRRLEEKSLPTATDDYIRVRSIEEGGVFVTYEPRSRKRKKTAEPDTATANQVGFGDSWLLLKKKTHKNEQNSQNDAGNADQKDDK